MLRLAEFDLDKARAGWPVCYRNGERPLEWHYFETSKGGYPIHSIHGHGVKMRQTNNGAYHRNGSANDFDLMLILEDEDGWIYWPGGDDAPVSGAVEVKFRDGRIVKSGGCFNWEHSECSADILWYRPIQTEKEYGVKIVFESKESRDKFCKHFINSKPYLNGVTSAKTFKR